MLFDAFERDIRAVLERFVLAELNDEETLGPSYGKARTRMDADDAADDRESRLLDYLDLREAYDLLNRHRNLLPVELAREVRDLTANLDDLVPIRNRVMHARPLRAGDAQTGFDLLSLFITRYWPDLRRVMGLLQADPDWEPLVEYLSEDSAVLHNLPEAEYEDTGLVGRDSEVEELLGLLRRRREPILTVTGEGGIGKTALALEVAYRLVDEPNPHFDAILWTSLKHERLTAHGVREIHDATVDLLSASQSLGSVLDADFRGSLNDLAEALAGLNVLIVFDNLETIGGAEFRELYETLPDTVSYLVTSRQGVGEFERRYPLSPLSDKQAVHLFNDLVRSRRMSVLLRLSKDSRLQIVQGLRNSPLAIRWWVLAVEAGRDPGQLMRSQNELLEFCVRSVYSALSESATEILVCLLVLNGPTTPDQLILLIHRSQDDVSSGLQDLIRGSLVKRETTSSAGGLISTIALTPTASRFLARDGVIEQHVANRIRERYEEYQKVEERRAKDAASQSLYPVAVRTDGAHQVPAAQLLRRALLTADKKRDIESALADIRQARTMSPDFWEVDRVEGYVRSRDGQNELASKLYLSAYEKASGQHRGLVAHHYAKHLARQVRDIEAAITFSREAHSILGLPETASSLGYYLVWAERFEEGVPLIEEAVTQMRGKSQRIGISALAKSYRRWADYAARAERNPVMQYERAWKGVEVVRVSVQAGVVDQGLNNCLAECAAEALRGAVSANANGTKLSSLNARLDILTEQLPSLAGCEEWDHLSISIAKLSQIGVESPARTRLVRRLRSLQHNLSSGNWGGGDVLRGQIVGLNKGFGFIQHPSNQGNIFFHGSGLAVGERFQDLKVGMAVEFVLVDSERGPRAEDVVTIQHWD